MEPKIKSFTVGSDPELFIVNRVKKQVVSSIGLIPGVKNLAWRDESWAPGYGLETDNILAEFNIPPVTKCSDFIECIEFMKSYILDFVQSKNPEYGILCQASAEVPESELQSKEAKEFGCDPDYNAYTCDINPKPKGDCVNIRSAGCHIHIGYENNSFETSVELVKYMDMYLGIPSLLIDGDARRRTLYGKAGAFRLQPWGVEYRTLSSKMIANVATIQFVWNGIVKAIDAYNKEVKLIDPTIVQAVINNSNVDAARELIKEYDLI